MSEEKDTDVLSFIREVQVAKPSDHVVEQLLKLISNGMLKPGDLLPPERELTKKFGISRNYVREGIKTLELYGLLKPIQGKGTVVTDSGIHGLQGIIKTVLKLTRSDLRSLVDTRILIETETARLAAIHSTKSDKQELGECIENLKKGVEETGGLMEDIRLHVKIADLSKNSILASLVRLITPDIILYYRDLRNDNSGATFGIHQQIAEYIIAGDADAAAQCMSEHLLDARKNFLGALERKQSVRRITDRAVPTINSNNSNNSNNSKKITAKKLAKKA